MPKLEAQAVEDVEESIPLAGFAEPEIYEDEYEVEEPVFEFEEPVYEYDSEEESEEFDYAITVAPPQQIIDGSYLDQNNEVVVEGDDEVIAEEASADEAEEGDDVEGEEGDDEEVKEGEEEEKEPEAPAAPTPPPGFGGLSLKDQLSAGQFGGKFQPGMGLRGLFQSGAVGGVGGAGSSFAAAEGMRNKANASNPQQQAAPAQNYQ